MKLRKRIPVLVCLLFGRLMVDSLAEDTDPPNYYDVMASIDQAREEGQPPRNISDIAMMAAVNSQEAGDHELTIRLFERALALDPQNAEAYRRYADYLILYRGVLNLGLYLTAKELIEQNPDDWGEEARNNLHRSMQIAYRDYKYGVPLFTSKMMAVFVQPYIEYREQGLDQLSLMGSTQNGTRFLENAQKEQQDGLVFFQSALKEQVNGIAYFNEQAKQNQEGIQYFQSQIPEQENGLNFFQNLVRSTLGEFNLWESYITQVYTADQGRPPTDSDNLGVVFGPDYEGQTLGTRRNLVMQDVGAYSEQVGRIQEDLFQTQTKIQQANQDLQQNLHKANQAAQDAATTREKIEQTEKNLAKIKENLEQLIENTRRQPKELEYGAEMKIVFPMTRLPDLTLFIRKIESRDNRYVIVEPTYDLHSVNSDIVEFGGSVGKRHLLGYNWDLEYNAGARRVEVSSWDDVTHDETSFEVTKAIGVNPISLTYSMPNKTLRLSGGAEFAEIENHDSDDDTGNQQILSLRYSLYPQSSELRFGQNRSTHFETGVRRVERVFQSLIAETQVEENFQPYFSIEPLGLVRGWLDFPMKYSLQAISVSGGPNEGDYYAHKFDVIPTWVPVYRLYDRNFLYGIEELRIGAPLAYSLGDGDFSFYQAGLRFSSRWVTRYNFTLVPTAEINYREYYDIDENDWGGRIKLVISM
jgi:tetratricopeptide (TPR) repeat protein